jgi:hypothetical protein
VTPAQFGPIALKGITIEAFQEFMANMNASLPDSEPEVCHVPSLAAVTETHAWSECSFIVAILGRLTSEDV